MTPSESLLVSGYFWLSFLLSWRTRKPNVFFFLLTVQLHSLKCKWASMSQRHIIRSFILGYSHYLWYRCSLGDSLNRMHYSDCLYPYSDSFYTRLNTNNFMIHHTLVRMKSANASNLCLLLMNVVNTRSFWPCRVTVRSFMSCFPFFWFSFFTDFQNSIIEVLYTSRSTCTQQKP